MTLQIVLLVLSFATLLNAFEFNLKIGTTKCFSEEIASGERIHVSWRMAKSYSSFVGVTFTAPDSTLLFQMAKVPHDHTERVKIRQAGEHVICFHSDSRGMRSASRTTVALNFKTEQEAAREIKKLEEHAASKKAGLSDRLRPLMNQAEFIENAVATLQDDYKYLMQREAAMRDTNESTCSRTTAITVVAVIVVVAVMLLRVYTLKRYLISKKILD